MLPPPPAIYTLSLHDALPICMFTAQTREAEAWPDGLAVSDPAVLFPYLMAITFDGSVEIVADDTVNYLRSEEHTSELQSRRDLVCRLLLEKKKSILVIWCTGM